MTDLEYLEKVKEMDKERFSSEGRMLDKCLESIEFRKIKALEIIAEELVLAVRELKVLIRVVRGKN